MLRQSLTQFVYNAAQSRNRTVAAFAVAFLIIWMTLVVVWFVVDVPDAYAPVLEDTATTTALVLPEANPLRLRIPEIAVDAPFEEPLGLKANGEIGVPESYETVGYYKFGPTPGEIGPAVVLGHVDSYEGPAVLFRLGQLEVGDEIMIDREDGTTATFAVESLERHEQAGFPTVKVYSDLPYAGLRLITCTGVYDHGSLRYSHNLIVFAKLVATSSSAVGEE
jgi:sortase (surface protein transpeptidase)